MSAKPLGMVKQIVEEAGMGISYAYDDLIFLEHNSFLLQFSDKDQDVLIHRNSEADEAVVSSDISRLQEVALTYKMRFITGDTYLLNQDDGENIRLEFIKAC